MTSNIEHEIPDVVPTHVAIIMDGNGRWAKSRGLPRLAGHKAGTENLRKIIKASVEFGIKFLTIYAFSTENWGRPEDEVSGLMKLFDDVFNRELAELHKQGARLIHVGRLDGINQSMKDKIKNGEEFTKDNKKLTLNIAFNYGSRDEILNSFQKIIKKGIAAEDVTQDMIAENLFTFDSPDPDMIIRTSGEQRSSNFLLWQSAYSEWYFPETLWPDFGREALLEAIHEFAKRERRFGKVKSSR